VLSGGTEPGGAGLVLSGGTEPGRTGRTGLAGGGTEPGRTGLAATETAEPRHRRAQRRCRGFGLPPGLSDRRNELAQVQPFGHLPHCVVAD
jgi:hypothetical protein